MLCSSHQNFPQCVSSAKYGLFFNSLISCFPDILLRYCLHDSQIVPVTPITTGIPFAFTLHSRWNSILRTLYFRIFSASFLISFLSLEIAASVNIHVLFSLSRIMMSGSLLRMFLLVCTCQFRNTATVPACFVLPILVPGLTGAHCLIYLYFLTYIKMQFSTHSIMSL